MIILDLNQVMLSNLMVQIGSIQRPELMQQVDENMVRHMILNSIRLLNAKFRDEYGELVIAADGANSWRREYFPYYKANRRKSQQTSELNWSSIFECMNKIRAELKEFFPYRVIHMERVEADDIIGTLVHDFHKIDPIMIISGDKDFNQLHFDGVKQYDPTRKKMIVCEDPDLYLEEHILRGDKGDGIPNVLSSDNCFVIGERQKTLTQKKIDDLIELGLPGKFDHEHYRNYMRNSRLIDLRFTPKEYKEKIRASYEEQADKNGSKLMSYFINNRLKNLMEHMGDFT